MKTRIGLLALLFLAVVVAAGAQAPARGAGQGRGAAAAAGAQLHGNLLQVMRGIVFPASNVVFTAQDDPTKVEDAVDPSTSPNPLNSSYGQWQAVENAGIALAEAANLLTIPGRMCSSGRPAPVQNADWQKFVQGLRDAGMQVYKLALTKDVDKMVDAADAVAAACGNCHDVYREKTPAQGGPKNRCLPS